MSVHNVNNVDTSVHINVDMSVHTNANMSVHMNVNMSVQMNASTGAAELAGLLFQRNTAQLSPQLLLKA